MDGLIQPGRTIRFDYPAHNYKGARRRMERRCLRVEHVRPLAAQPLAAITTELDPNLERGEVLVTGEDLDKSAERSFYVERMERVEEAPQPDGPFELVLCGEDSPPEVVTKASTLAAALAGIREWLLQPMGLIVGVRRSA